MNVIEDSFIRTGVTNTSIWLQDIPMNLLDGTLLILFIWLEDKI